MIRISKWGPDLTSFVVSNPPVPLFLDEVYLSLK